MLNDVGSDMTYPFWPVYVTRVIGAGMTELGFIEGFGIFVESLAKISLGEWSDRSGRRKPFIWIGYLLSAFARFCYGLAQAWTHLLALMGVYKVGKGRDSPRDALIADVIPEKERGEAYGILRALDSAGAMLGPLVGLLVFPFLNFRPLFFFASTFTILSVLIVLAFVREVRAKRKAARRLLVPIKGRFLLLLVSYSLFVVVFMNYAFFVSAAYEAGVALLALPVLMIVFNASYSAFCYPTGLLLDRVKKRHVLASGLIAYALLCFYCSYAIGFLAFLPAFILFGYVMATTDVSARALVAEISTPEERASYFGTFYMITGLLRLVGLGLVGFFWDLLGRTAVFTIASLLSITACIVVEASRL